MTKAHRLGATHRLDKDACPWCGRGVDAHAGFDYDDGPDPGDVALCLECGKPAVFNRQLRLRRATPAESAEARRQQPASFELMARFQAWKARGGDA